MQQYIAATDPRLTTLQRKFEELLTSCPQDLNGRQSTKLVRKGDAVILEINTSFKLSVNDDGLKA
jgi:hypothetical protein